MWNEFVTFISDRAAIRVSLDATTATKAVAEDIEQLGRDQDRINRERERAAWLFSTGRVDVDGFDKLQSRRR